MEKREEIIEYFNTHHDNRSTVIAKYFNYTVTYVNKVLDAYLSAKRNYISEKPKVERRKINKYKSESLDTGVIEFFTSLTAIAKARKVITQTLAYHLNDKKYAKVTHKLTKETYIYTKL